MKILIGLAKKIDNVVVRRIINKREPDLTVNYDEEHIYMNRWWVIPRNRIFNIYLHQFEWPDPDHTLHDHPWFSMSFVLFSGYSEQIVQYGGCHKYYGYRIGDLIFRSPWNTHRISNVLGNISRTLFITGPILRKWGFHNVVLGWEEAEAYKARDLKL